MGGGRSFQDGCAKAFGGHLGRLWGSTGSSWGVWGFPWGPPGTRFEHFSRHMEMRSDHRAPLRPKVRCNADVYDQKCTLAPLAPLEVDNHLSSSDSMYANIWLEAVYGKRVVL